MQYDTRIARRTANNLQTLSDDLRQMSGTRVNRMRERAGDALVGEAGTALQEELAALDARAADISGGLSQIANALNEYARKLEELDQRAKTLIGKN